MLSGISNRLIRFLKEDGGRVHLSILTLTPIRSGMANAKRPALVRVLLGGVLASALAGMPSSAQDTIRVSGDDLACPACVITVDSVLTIGGLEGPGLDVVDRYSRVGIDRTGRVLVSLYRFPEISVFDSTGAFLRTFGRSGEGPGEYQFVHHVDPGLRYIHVFDMRGRTVLDYDFGFVRADAFPAQMGHSDVLESEDVVFAGVVPTRASAGHPLHVLDLTGALESFAGQGAVVGDPGWEAWPIAGNAQTLWVLKGAGAGNRLTRWDRRGGEPQNLTVYEWMVEEKDLDLKNIKLDARGLWVLWGLPGGGRRLDLFDPDTGRTIARSGDDVVGTFVDGTGSIYLKHPHESDAGIPYITLFKIDFSRPSREPDPS